MFHYRLTSDYFAQEYDKLPQSAPSKSSKSKVVDDFKCFKPERNKRKSFWLNDTL